MTLRRHVDECRASERRLHGHRAHVTLSVGAESKWHVQTDDVLARFRRFYDEFGPEWIPRLEELYAPGFVFADSFHTVRGDFAQLRKYFERILTALDVSRFITEDDATGRDGSYVRWRWEWKRKASDSLRIVPGVTHLRFAADGRITHHTDLFDAASGFYEALPVVGSLLRQIKKRV
jgi:hypothetical protein